MKLVILLPTLPAYRKEFFETLNLHLQQKGIELTIIHGTSFLKKSIKPDTDPKYSAIPLKNVEFNVFGFRIIWWKKILQNIRKINPNLLIILFTPGNVTLWIVQIYCYIFNIKIGIWSSGFIRKEIKGFKKKLRKKILNFFLFHAKFHICYGTKYKSELLALGIEKSKIFVAQNTLNVEKILAINLERSKIILPDTTTFLFVGALIEDKKLDLAIKAIAKLVRENFDIQFNIIGQGSIINELKSLVVDEHMEDKIYVLGPQYDQELISYFLKADIFLLPGTGGLAINEAMAYGLPILSTIGDGTVADLLFEGLNGYYLNEDASVENIYAICKKALVLNKANLLKMGIESREIIKEKATLQKMILGFESAINYGIRL